MPRHSLVEGGDASVAVQFTRSVEFFHRRYSCMACNKRIVLRVKGNDRGQQTLEWNIGTNMDELSF